MAQNNIGKVVVKFMADLRELREGTEEAESIVNAWASAIKKYMGPMGVAAVASIASAAVAGVTKSVIELGKESVKSFGEFEQLEQGIAKIFDEVDQTQILTDAQNAWNDLNLSANQYMENISGVGAVFAQTMGDQAGYDAARKGMKALADYATGTGGDINNLMAKFQLITRQTTQYQVIADQFAGILPQTSKDFLEQAQAAGILSDQYKALTEVPIVEYQKAVVDMIELGVEKQGLLGNTAAETANTITGSIAGAKSAVQNLITGLADPKADIAALTKTALTAIKAAAVNILGALKQAFKGIAEFIREALPELIAEVPKLLADIGPDLVNALIDAVVAITDQAPEILTALLQVALQIVNLVIARLPEIIGAVTNVIIGVIVAISNPDNLRLLLQAAFSLLMGIVQAIPLIVTQLAEALPDIITGLVDFLMSPETLKQVATASLMLFLAIVSVLPQVLEALVKGFSELIGQLWDNLKQRWTDFAASFGISIGTAIANAMNKVIEFIEGMINGAIDTINMFMDVLNSIPGVSVDKLSLINLGRIPAPTMAEGGLVRSATPAIIGEAGKEAVIPLERNQDNWSGLLAEALSEKMSESGGGAPITIYMTNEINNKLDIDEVARELATSIRRAI